MANRHLSRIIVMQTLFEWDFRPDADIFEISKRNIEAYEEECDLIYIEESIKNILDNLKEIDIIICKAAPEWPIDQIATIDKSILRLSVYELLFNSEIPPKVVINEAVELGKTFGSENSSKFINGVLGTLFKQDERFNDSENLIENDEENEKLIDINYKEEDDGK